MLNFNWGDNINWSDAICVWVNTWSNISTKIIWGWLSVCHLFPGDKMRLVILDTSADVAVWSAKYVMKKINDFNPGPDKYFVLGLPTGNDFSVWYCFTFKHVQKWDKCSMMPYK